MKYFARFNTVSFIFILLSLSSCRKALLNENPSSSLVVPKTLEDFQQLLDNDIVMMQTPVLGEVSADDYYLPFFEWQGLEPELKNSYTWSRDIFEGNGNVKDWNTLYEQVFYSNVILEGLNGIPRTSENEMEWERIKGAALFHRSYAFYNLVQVFAAPYDSATAGTDQGIPLRLTADLRQPSTRATIKTTYDQIIADLELAKGYLINDVDRRHPNRPSRSAVYALLARLYLSVGAYTHAGTYADSCLQLHGSLIDYNHINTSSSDPFEKMNTEENIFSSVMLTNALFGTDLPGTLTDTLLYASYDSNDLRKEIFFQLNDAGQPYKKSGYDNLFGYSGLAVDEMYLIRAESSARAGNVAAAMKKLNDLLIKRFSTAVPYVPYTATSATAAVNIILQERRKELTMRGLRWSDLRRLNKGGAGILLKRELDGKVYSLPPNDKRYVLPIPPDEIVKSGIPQNPR